MLPEVIPLSCPGPVSSGPVKGTPSSPVQILSDQVVSTSFPGSTSRPGTGLRGVGYC